MYVKESGKGLADVMGALKFFQNNKCYVGIPGAKGHAAARE